MAHSAAAARADSNWWVAARLMTAVNLTVQGGIGSALIVWALTRPPADDAGLRGAWAELKPVATYLGGVAVLLGCVPHWVIANRIWAYRRGALRALSVVAGGQAVVQLLLLLIPSLRQPITSALASHAAVLILSALAGWKTHCATRHVSHHPSADASATHVRRAA